MSRRTSKTDAPTTPIVMELSEDEANFMKSEANQKRILEISASWAMGGSNLSREGRLFVREGTLQKMCRKAVKPRQFFLFNDCLVYGTILTKAKYKSQEILPLGSMTIESREDTAEGSNGFQINSSEKSFVVYAPSVQDKTSWMTGLNRFIDLCKASGMGDDAGARAVWISDKKVDECMVRGSDKCKPKFTLVNRRHHCRNCGKLVCGPCSSEKVTLNLGKPERACVICWKQAGGVNKGDVPVVGKASSEKEKEDEIIDSDSDSDSDDDNVVSVVAGSSASTVNHDAHAAGDLSSGEKAIHKMSDADRITIMTMVKEGKIDLPVAMAAIEKGESLESFLASNAPAAAPDAPKAEGPHAEALYANDDPEQADELVFDEGAIIILTREVNDQWLEGYVQGAPDVRGIFPSAFVEVKIPL